MDSKPYVSWGLPGPDARQIGLERGCFNMLRVPDYESGVSAACHFLRKGLALDERVAVVAFDNSEALLARFAACGFSFDTHLQSEELLYYYYKPSFSRTLSFTPDYDRLFQELMRLSGRAISRIVFFNSETLINLQSPHLVRESLQLLVSATSNRAYTCLGFYVPQTDLMDVDLHGTCKSYLPGYFSLNRMPEGEAGEFLLRDEKSSPGAGGLDIRLEMPSGSWKPEKQII